MSTTYEEVKYIAQFFPMIDANPEKSNQITQYYPKEKLNFKGPYVLLKYENGLNIVVNAYDYDEILHNIRHPIDVLNTVNDFYLFKGD